MVCTVSSPRLDRPGQTPTALGRARSHARRRRRLPIAGVVLLFAGALTGVWYGYLHWLSRRVTVHFTRQGVAVPALQLTFFPDQLAFAAPSPPPPIGQLRLDGQTAVSLDAELVPERAVVRYSGPGVGTGFVFVRLGQDVPSIELRPGKVLHGRVGEPIGLWCYGWRCAGFRPVADAEVVLMGGGEHGIDLASARTDSDGRFTLEGIDGELDGLGLRARAKGFAIGHLALGRLVDGGDTGPVFALARTRAMTGKVILPASVVVTALRVLARGLPGVEATLASDGTFVLDHVPPGVEPRLVLHGLPPTLTHAPVRAQAGVALRIDVVPGAVVRGRVVDAETKAPLAGALVFCGEQDAVRADAHGCFELRQLLPGEVEIQAQWQVTDARRHTVQRAGRRRVSLASGKIMDEIVITID